MKLINETTGKVLAENLEVADTPAKRMKGLLGRAGLLEGEGLHIIPCSSIHSFFMKFKFDAIFVNKKNIVCDLVENMSPSRIKICFCSYSVIELPKYTIRRTETKLGDKISFLK